MNKSNNTIKRNIIVPIIVSVLCITIIMIIVNAIRFDISNVLSSGMIALLLGLLLLDSLEEKEKKLSMGEKEVINILVEEGNSTTKIADNLGRSEGIVRKYLMKTGYDISSEVSGEIEENVSENEVETCKVKKAVVKIGMVLKSLMIKVAKVLIVIHVIVFLLLLVIVDSFNGNIKISIDTPQTDKSIINEVNSNDLDVTTDFENEIKE